MATPTPPPASLDHPLGNASAARLPLVLLKALRPRQWTKNALVFMALLFTVNQRWSPNDAEVAWQAVGFASLAFVAFCLLASAQYLINDVLDAPQDRVHPKNRFRPIAAGLVPVSTALALAVVLVVLGIGASLFVGPAFTLVALGYLVLTAAYSVVLKHVVIVDVLVLASGFVLRAAAGAVAIAVPISPWLYVCTLLGALFLSLVKRRQERALLGTDAGAYRRILEEYPLPLLDQMINVVASGTVIAYSFYTFNSESLPGNHAMMLTIPFVIYGVFRYLYLVYTKNLGDSPDEVLFSDRPLLLSVVLWLVAAGVLLLLFRPNVAL